MAYAYSFNGENFYGEFDTIEEALAEAKEDRSGTYVYVGEDGEAFKPEIDGDYIIDNLREQAYDEYGECAENYLDGVSTAETNELTQMLTATFNDWAKKNNQEPKFYSVVNIERYSLEAAND